MQGSYGTFKILDERTPRGVLLGDKVTDVFFRDRHGRERVEGATLRETLFNRRVRHPNIMHAVQLQQCGRTMRTRMPVAPETLHDFIKMRGRRTRIRESHRVLADIMHALAHMHRNGVTHGDLKPENIVRNRDGCVQLIDFGAVQWGCSDTSPTASSANTGKPVLKFERTYTSYWYVPPEDALHDRYGCAADIWAVGLIMVFYWTRVRSIQAYSLAEVAAWFRRNPQVDITTTRPGGLPIPAKMQALIRRMLDYNPETRISAEEVLCELGETPRPGTFCDVPRTHIGLAAQFCVASARPELAAECARRMAHAVFTPWAHIYLDDLAHAVWGDTSSRRLREVRTAVRRVLQRL